MRRFIFDIETDGFLDELTRIHCLVLKDVDTGEVISCTDNDPSYTSVREGLRLLEEAAELIGHNVIAFDIPAIRKVVPEWNPGGKVYDTLVLSRLLWADIKNGDFERAKRGKFPKNLIGRYSLEAFGHRLGTYKGDYHGPWDAWSRTMQDYCEQDVEVNYRLWLRACKRWKPIEADDPGYSDESVELEHSVARIIQRQIRHGFAFNIAAAQELYGQLVERRFSLERQLKATFKPWFRGREVVTTKRSRTIRKGVKAPTHYPEGGVYQKLELVEFNPTSRDHISDRLIKLRGWRPVEFGKDGKPTIDDAVLSRLPYPEAKVLAEYLMVQKRIGQLAEGKEAWLKVERGGRIHGSVISNGAVTGRMTHMHPNVAQVPKVGKPYGKECRALFMASTGFTLVGCDADALELRCLAGYLARFDGGAYIRTVLDGDKANGTDMHSVNCRALGMDPKGLYEVNGEMLPGREIAKTWFYAWAYGAGPYKLGCILGATGSEDDIKRRGAAAAKRFLRGLPAIGKLLEKIKEKVERDGYLRAVDGRKLTVRSAHAALNTLLQSAGAIFMKRALVILDNTLQEAGLEPGRDYEFVANIHDEWQIEVRPEHVELVKQTAADAIRLAGEYYSFRCPLAGNADEGPNWAATH